MKNFKIGMEIELVFNANLVPMDVGAYHSDNHVNGLEGWRVTSDGSLRDYDMFRPFGETAELISNQIRSKDAYFKLMDNFKKFFSRDGKYKLNEVLCFNTSCGNHVHFSLIKHTFQTKAHMNIYLETRALFFRKVMLSALPLKTKGDIKNHYFRSYAKKLTKNEIRNPKKYTEFNLYSEMSGRGLEWRSPNLLNIQTWEEFDIMMNIIWECIEYFCDRALNWKYEHNKNIKKVQWQKKELIIKKPILLDLTSDDLVTVNLEKGRGTVRKVKHRIEGLTSSDFNNIVRQHEMTQTIELGLNEHSNHRRLAGIRTEVNSTGTERRIRFEDSDGNQIHPLPLEENYAPESMELLRNELNRIMANPPIEIPHEVPEEDPVEDYEDVQYDEGLANESSYIEYGEDD